MHKLRKPWAETSAGVRLRRKNRPSCFVQVPSEVETTSAGCTNALSSADDATARTKPVAKLAAVAITDARNVCCEFAVDCTTSAGCSGCAGERSSGRCRTKAPREKQTEGSPLRPFGAQNLVIARSFVRASHVLLRASVGAAYAPIEPFRTAFRRGGRCHRRALAEQSVACSFGYVIGNKMVFDTRLQKPRCARRVNRLPARRYQFSRTESTS